MALVVFECRDSSGTLLWAWGKVIDGAPGFESITYTRTDGLSFDVEVEGEPPVLGRHLFTVQIPP